MLTTTGTPAGGFVATDLAAAAGAVEVRDLLAPEVVVELRPPARAATRELPVESTPVPCVRRPGTTFVHLDGACRCFVGGPAPEFSTPPHIAQLAPLAC